MTICGNFVCFKSGAGVFSFQRVQSERPALCKYLLSPPLSHLHSVQHVWNVAYESVFPAVSGSNTGGQHTKFWETWTYKSVIWTSLALQAPLNVNFSPCFVMGGQRLEIRVSEERQEVERLWVNDGLILVSSTGGRTEWKCVGFVNSNVEEQRIEWEKAEVEDKEREKPGWEL